jgi:hypothetical protein
LERLYISKLLSQKKRHADMVTMMKSVIDANLWLSLHGRMILSIRCKNAISDHRSSLRHLSAVLQSGDAQRSAAHASRLREFRSRVSVELDTLFREVIGLIDARQFPRCVTPMRSCSTTS